MSGHAKVAALITLVLLAGCGHSTVPTFLSNPGSNALESVSTASKVVTGNFTEFSLPAGVHPDQLTRGPYGTLWFVKSQLADNPAIIYQMVDTTGVIHSFTAPAPFASFGTDVISFGRAVYYSVVNTQEEDEGFIARVTPEGTFSFTDAGDFVIALTNFALGPDGKIWYGFCNDPCDAGVGHIEPHGPGLIDGFEARVITGGPDSNMSFTATFSGVPPPPASDSRVYIVSATGAIVKQVAFPNGSGPAGIVLGSDHNLWVTEPGINKVARMTPAGAITQFSIPTANAGANQIAAGWDGALWFTETKANKIGRITTNGIVTEYSVPTAGSQPTGIATCSSTNCGTHGGVWFTETAANKIGKFNAPI